MLGRTVDRLLSERCLVWLLVKLSPLIADNLPLRDSDCRLFALGLSSSMNVFLISPAPPGPLLKIDDMTGCLRFEDEMLLPGKAEVESLTWLPLENQDRLSWSDRAERALSAWLDAVDDVSWSSKVVVNVPDF
jgi:hypothetical protein